MLFRFMNVINCIVLILILTLILLLLLQGTLVKGNPTSAITEEGTTAAGMHNFTIENANP